jgi:salicylate hydroxylase
MKIVIIGAGIAGLATARALSVSGLEDYMVLEQAEELTAIGAGIQLTNNATRVLKFLGLIEDLIKTESQSQLSTYRDLMTDEIFVRREYEARRPLRPGEATRWSTSFESRRRRRSAERAASATTTATKRLSFGASARKTPIGGTDAPVARQHWCRRRSPSSGLLGWRR